MASIDSSRVLHPVYLDVPMMVSFLAALTGGISFEDETVRRTATGTERKAEAAAGVRLPSLVSFLSFDASARAGRADRGEEGEETRTIRQHTAASHFNALYNALREREMFIPIGDASAADAVEPGDVVEITGQFAGNPLESVLAFAGQIIPYISLAESNPALREAIAGPTLSMEAMERELAAMQEQATILEERLAGAQRSGNPSRKGEVDEIKAALEAKRAEVAKPTR